MSHLEWLELLRKFKTAECLEIFVRLKEYKLCDTQAALLRVAAQDRLNEI